jgi:hypothetical protein
MTRLLWLVIQEESLLAAQTRVDWDWEKYLVVTYQHPQDYLEAFVCGISRTKRRALQPHAPFYHQLRNK